MQSARRQTVCPSLLSREAELFCKPRGFEDHLQITAVKQPPVKSVKFAASPVCRADDSFHVLYNKQTFSQHLNDLQVNVLDALVQQG